ncbi:DUF6221 family protein [Streptomyces gardneri]|uniref:DUF6221 family protein n=1 Tax=Streptomyces gardneri TaxID=66892 RepID=UPI0035DAE650
MSQQSIIAFLEARLAEEEKDAQAANQGWYGYGPDESIAFIPMEDSRHIARHSPARVLEEIAAKRHILICHRAVTTDCFVHPDGSPAGPLEVCHTCDANSTDADWPDFPCQTLCFLALPYAPHRDYREEWRP